MVELVEVAEGVLEPSDHLGTHPDSFLFKIRSWNMFQMFIFMYFHNCPRKILYNVFITRVKVNVKVVRGGYINLIGHLRLKNG